MSCYVCQSPDGCERCQGGPGEQGFSHDEKELLELRDQLQKANAENLHVRGLVVAVELSSKAGVSCPWCGGPKGEHAENCRAFESPGVVRRGGA